MKRIVLLLMVSLLCAYSANTETDKSEPSKKDAYCSDETDKSSVCGTDESADMSGHKDFRETKNQSVDSDMQEALSVSQKKESAILYFGYLSYPWCAEALSVVNEVAKADKQHVLHIRTRDDRKELPYTPKQKLEMISYTKQFMEKDDQGECQLYVSFVVVVKGGKAASGHIGTVDGYDAHERKMTEEKTQELKKIYEDMSSAVAKQGDFMSSQVKQLTLLVFFLVLGLVLPFAFHLFEPQAGTAFLPMHIPALLCGLMRGLAYGALVGMLTPLLLSALTGMLPPIPIRIAMCLELSAYGFLSGWMTKRLPLYLSLIIAMLAGRAVSGLANPVLLSMAHKAYTMRIFLTAAFVTAIPGIVLQLVIIPSLVSVVKKPEVRIAED